MLNDYFKLAITNIKKRKLRSWLTLIGIFISVAVIFILISLSLGLQGAIQEQFRQLGTDKFFIMPKGQAGAPGSGGAVTLTTKDFDVIKRISGVKQAVYFVAGNGKIEFDNKAKYFMVIGIPPESINLYMEATSITMDSGRAISKSDVGKVMIGWDYKYSSVFPKPVLPGSKLLINGQEFKVSGIISRVGNPSDDNAILMSINDFKALFNSGDRVDEIMVQIEPGQNIKDVAARTELRLRNFRGVSEKNVDFTILTPEELLNSFQSILTIITAFLISIASISLLVGAIGIANTMYTSVLERTSEIGLMKAIGARNSDILLIFVIESGMIGMVGGIMGVIIGIGISKAMEFIAVNQLNTTLLKAAIPWYLIVGCIVFAFLIGAISGFFPARQASKIKVVDALRYE